MAKQKKDEEPQDDEPKLPLGRYKKKRTNEIELPAPIVSASGHVDEKTIYVTRGGKTFGRRYVHPADAKSARQLDQRERFKTVQRNWSTLTDDERAAWQKFALRHCFADRGVRKDLNLGQNAYAQAQSYRLAWGGSMTTTPPVHPPAPPPKAIEQVAPPSPDVFAFRIRHGQKSIEGWRVLFEMTDATVTLRRTPHIREFVWAGETAADSFLPLGPDGAVYLLETPRFEIDAGRRYGARARIVTPEGLAGPPTTGDFIRVAPED